MIKDTVEQRIPQNTLMLRLLWRKGPLVLHYNEGK